MQNITIQNENEVALIQADMRARLASLEAVHRSLYLAAVGSANSQQIDLYSKSTIQMRYLEAGIEQTKFRNLLDVGTEYFSKANLALELNTYEWVDSSPTVWYLFTNGPAGVSDAFNTSSFAATNTNVTNFRRIALVELVVCLASDQCCTV